ncbi:unnamed protein product, partial [Mesorhabditis spiculigera]
MFAADDWEHKFAVAWATLQVLLFITGVTGIMVLFELNQNYLLGLYGIAWSAYFLVLLSLKQKIRWLFIIYLIYSRLVSILFAAASCWLFVAADPNNRPDNVGATEVICLGVFALAVALLWTLATVKLRNMYQLMGRTTSRRGIRRLRRGRMMEEVILDDPPPPIYTVAVAEPELPPNYQHLFPDGYPLSEKPATPTAPPKPTELSVPENLI